MTHVCILSQRSNVRTQKILQMDRQYLLMTDVLLSTTVPGLHIHVGLLQCLVHWTLSDYVLEMEAVPWVNGPGVIIFVRQILYPDVWVKQTIGTKRMIIIVEVQLVLLTVLNLILNFLSVIVDVDVAYVASDDVNGALITQYYFEAVKFYEFCMGGFTEINFRLTLSQRGSLTINNIIVTKIIKMCVCV